MNVGMTEKIYDTNDTSTKTMTLHGVNVGSYANDILAKWYTTQDIVISNWEKFICMKLSDQFKIPVTNEKEVLIANTICKETFHMNIAEWVMSWME